ncbi:MAG TPA: Asp-tRNA(Asn)/Glu-tRNA(Gln) amidotransferase subunit GatC [Epulopiscium sp.]|nr:Asp-tRNA(Asn)/Glu-tRNA(Gln) amidotransferase subunit GatC [Candidatus Epulonipiscium sp.]
MKITKEDVLKIADIAHLSLTEEETQEFTSDLEKMVAFAEQLNEVDTTHVDTKIGEPTLYNVLRKDEVKPSMAKEELLANAPQEKNGCFFVPQIVE